MARWLDVKNVEGGYGSVKIIHGIDMHVDEGEFVTIIGPNGCGKSTLIKIIFGIATYYGGKVEHKGEDVSGWRTDRLATRGCLLYTSPSPRDGLLSRMPSSA